MTSKRKSITPIIVDKKKPTKPLPPKKEIVIQVPSRKDNIATSDDEHYAPFPSAEKTVTDLTMSDDEVGFATDCENSLRVIKDIYEGGKIAVSKWRESVDEVANVMSECAECRIDLSSAKDQIAELEERVSKCKKKLSGCESDLKALRKEKHSRRQVTSIYIGAIVDKKKKLKKQLDKLNAKTDKLDSKKEKPS